MGSPHKSLLRSGSQWHDIGYLPSDVSLSAPTSNREGGVMRVGFLLALIAVSQSTLLGCQAGLERESKGSKVEESQLPESSEQNFRMYFSTSPHVLLVSVHEETLYRRGEGRSSVIRRKAVVERSYKGAWKQGEAINFSVSTEGGLDAYSKSDTISPIPRPRFVLFVDYHSEADTSLDPGLYWKYQSALDPLLEELSD